MPPSRTQIWLLAIRPRTLIVSVSPVLVGLAFATRQVPLDGSVAIATLLTAILLQIVANLANDYADALTGVDDEDRLGPIRVTQSGLLDPASVRRATMGLLAFAGLLGAFLVYRGGWPILLVGIAAMGAAVGYSMGTKPLSWLGLGEFLAFVFFGPVAVAGTAYLQIGALEATALLASLPAGFMAAGLMLVNNLRDITSDEKAGKRTIAVRFGERATRKLYAALIVFAFLSIALLARTTGWPTLIAFFAAPIAAREVGRVGRDSGATLNGSLARTAMLSGVTGVLLALGLLW